MGYTIFLDDERFPPESKPEWKIARHITQLRGIVDNYGPPEFISFDHDLGEGTMSGYEIAQLLAYSDQKTREGITNYFTAEFIGGFQFPDNFDFIVHSQNPVGGRNIDKFLQSYLTHIRR